MSKLTVSALYTYPVKGLRGISSSVMDLGLKGPQGDRRWMVINPNNKFITQRQLAHMCLINTSLKDGVLTLSAPGKQDCVIDPDSNSENGLGHKAKQVQVWRDSVLGLDCGDKVSAWLSDFLEKECRLVHMPDHSERLVNMPDDDLSLKHGSENLDYGFADAFPVLIATDASLQDFNSKLNAPISMQRFRPNIVIAGSEPWAEDSWKQLRIGGEQGIEFSLMSACSRCIVPSIDPATGEKQPQIIDALNKYRRHEHKTYFGQNAIYHALGNIKLGDSVELMD